MVRYFLLRKGIRYRPGSSWRRDNDGGDPSIDTRFLFDAGSRLVRRDERRTDTGEIDPDHITVSP
jgi:hypothetical protein